MPDSYILSPLTPITDRIDVSHRAGWALYWSEETRSKLITTSMMDVVVDMVEPTDYVFVYHGMEFRDVLNLPGGASPELALRAKRFGQLAKKLGKNLISMDRHMPDYVTLLADRNLLSPGFSLTGSGYRLWPTDNPRRLVIGDSHALSMYDKQTRIARHDGATLYGTLQAGLPLIVDQYMTKTVKELWFYYGNIDVRHHLCRPGAVPVKILLENYKKQLNEIQKAYPRVEITAVAPLPIEDESRRLPKSGWYKGTPFYGSWDERTDLRHNMTVEMSRWEEFSLYEHPDSFTDLAGALSLDVMEKPQSVHIRPDQYLFRQRGNQWYTIS